jgi:hypothetical protein
MYWIEHGGQLLIWLKEKLMRYSDTYSLVLDMLNDAPDKQPGDVDLVDRIVCIDPDTSEQLRPEIGKYYEKSADFKAVVLKLRNELRNEKKSQKAIS